MEGFLIQGSEEFEESSQIGFQSEVRSSEVGKDAKNMPSLDMKENT